GLAAWFCAVPALAAAGRAPLPDAGPAAVAALARGGLAAIARARSRRREISARVAPALLTGWQAGTILGRAAGDPARVAAGRLTTSEARRRLVLAWRGLSGRW